MYVCQHHLHKVSAVYTYIHICIYIYIYIYTYMYIHMTHTNEWHDFIHMCDVTHPHGTACSATVWMGQGTRVNVTCDTYKWVESHIHRWWDSFTWVMTRSKRRTLGSTQTNEKVKTHTQKHTTYKHTQTCTTHTHTHTRTHTRTHAHMLVKDSSAWHDSSFYTYSSANTNNWHSNCWICRSLLQKSLIKETMFCKRDLWF